MWRYAGALAAVRAYIRSVDGRSKLGYCGCGKAYIHSIRAMGTPNSGDYSTGEGHTAHKRARPVNEPTPANVRPSSEWSPTEQRTLPVGALRRALATASEERLDEMYVKSMKLLEHQPSILHNRSAFYEVALSTATTHLRRSKMCMACIRPIIAQGDARLALRAYNVLCQAEKRGPQSGDLEILQLLARACVNAQDLVTTQHVWRYIKRVPLQVDVHTLMAHAYVRAGAPGAALKVLGLPLQRTSDASASHWRLYVPMVAAHRLRGDLRAAELAVKRIEHFTTLRPASVYADLMVLYTLGGYSDDTWALILRLRSERFLADARHLVCARAALQQLSSAQTTRSPASSSSLLAADARWSELRAYAKDCGVHAEAWDNAEAEKRLLRLQLPDDDTEFTREEARETSTKPSERVKTAEEYLRGEHSLYRATSRGDLDDALCHLQSALEAKVKPRWLDVEPLMEKLAAQGRVAHAEWCFDGMVAADVRPNRHAYLRLMIVYSLNGCTDKIEEVLSRVAADDSVRIDERMLTARVRTYAHIGDVDGARQALADFKTYDVEPNAHSIRAFLYAYVRAEKPADLENAVTAMAARGMPFDAPICSLLLTAYARAGDSEGMQSVWARMRERKIPADAHIFMTLMRVFIRHEDWTNVVNCFRQMLEWSRAPSFEVCHYVLENLYVHGRVDEASVLIQKLRGMGVILPNKTRKMLEKRSLHSNSDEGMYEVKLSPTGTVLVESDSSDRRC